MTTQFNKKYLKGWRFESQRHALAARGIETKKKSQFDLQREIMAARERQRATKDLRAKHSTYLDVLSQYLKFQRTGRGAGSMYTFDDAEKAYKTLMATGDVVLVRQASKDFDRIKKYHYSGWVPSFKPTKTERRKLKKAEALAKKESERGQKAREKSIKTREQKRQKWETKEYEKILKKVQVGRKE
jgi:hypothetical protein